MFNSEEEILFFGPRTSRKWSNHRYLLWPALAYRVTAPRIRNYTLNPLQKAVALMARTGLLQANEVGPKLDIHEKLAGHILMELWQFGYLTPTGVSEEGLKALRDDSVVSCEWVSGFVFQDPWSGKLWPRFVNDFNFCDHSTEEGGIRLYLGTEGNPKDVRPTWVNFPAGAPSLPYPVKEDIVRAIRRGDKRGYSKRSATDVDEEDDVIQMAETRIGFINQVTEIEAKVRRVYLTTILYVVEEEQDDSRRPSGPPEWAVCDPFGFREMPELYNQVREVAREDKNLQRTITRLLEDSGYKPGYAGIQEWEDRAVEEAQECIMRIFSSSIQGYEGVFKQLVAFESKYRIARDLPERTDSLPSELRKVVESIFIWCIITYPPGDIWKRVYYEDPHRRTKKIEWFPRHYKSDYQEAYKYAFSELGLIPTNRFLNTKPGDIRAAVGYGHHSKLAGSICAQVMHAAEVKEHPLRRTAREIPELLQVLDVIASVGGKDAHADQPVVKKETTLEQCQALRRDCFRVVASLLNLNLNQAELDL